MKKSKKIVLVFIIVVLIALLCGIMYFQKKNFDNTNKELKDKISSLEDKVSSLEREKNDAIKELEETKIEEEETTNEIDSNKTENEEKNNTEANEESKENENKNLRKFTFNSPAGVYEVEAEQAFQASGFAGASAHVFYLKNGELYYHHYSNKEDIKLATGIDSIEKPDQSEYIIAKKGNNAKVLVENDIIQYK